MRRLWERLPYWQLSEDEMSSNKIRGGIGSRSKEELAEAVIVTNCEGICGIVDVSHALIEYGGIRETLEGRA